MYNNFHDGIYICTTELRKKKYIYRIIKIIYLIHKAQFSLETLGREKIE